ESSGVGESDLVERLTRGFDLLVEPGALGRFDEALANWFQDAAGEFQRGPRPDSTQRARRTGRRNAAAVAVRCFSTCARAPAIFTMRRWNFLNGSASIF